MTDFNPAMFGAPGLRVGTAEREQAAEALGKHFAAGRLDVDEYDERVGRAYAAKTVGELTPLFTDLPTPAPAPVPAPPPLAQRRMAQGGYRPRTPVPFLLIALLVLGVAVGVTTHFVPFFLFPVFFFVFAHHRRYHNTRWQN